MKAVVVDIHKGMAAVLLEDGCIVKIQDRNYQNGEVIHMNQIKDAPARKWIAWVASVAVFLAVTSTSTWAYMTPYSYVSLDVNPSIEYSVNRFDRVLSVKALNPDGEAIIQHLLKTGLKNKSIQEALQLTVNQIKEYGYLNTTSEAGIVIATSGDSLEKADELALELREAVEVELADEQNVVEIEASSVGQELVQKAKELGVTPGKLNLVQKLQDSSAKSEEIKIEEWLKKPVKDILKATQENRKAEKAAEKVAEKGNQAEDDGSLDAE